MANAANLSQRLQKVQTELEIIQRNRSTEATKAAKALASVDQEDANMLAAIAPMLPDILKFTAQDIERNSNGEVEKINATLTQLKTYLEERLAYYEEHL